MIVLGLTGSVGMGKTEISNYFKKMKVDVFDSDYQVKLLYKKNYIIKKIKKFFPSAFTNNKINKKLLADIVFKEKNKLKLLEALIHTSLKIKQRKWVRKKIREKSKIIVFDVPLLFEKDNIKKYDYIIVVSCNKEIQKYRVLKRKDWDTTRLNYTLQQQIDNKIKKKKADIIIKTDRGKRYALKKVLKTIEISKKATPRSMNKVLSYFSV